MVSTQPTDKPCARCEAPLFEATEKDFTLLGCGRCGGAWMSNEDAAVELMTKLRWPHGVACPKCGGADPYKLTPKAQPGRPARKGLYKCSQCRKQFSVTTGSVFEASHLPLSRSGRLRLRRRAPGRDHRP